jgi:hypothetical protein
LGFALLHIQIVQKMNLRNRLLTLLFSTVFFLSLPGKAQQSQPIWSKARIFLDARHGMKELGKLGVETDHGLHKPGYFFESAFQEKELQAIRNAGFRVEVMVKDIQKDFLQRNSGTGPVDVQAEQPYAAFCNKVKPNKTPNHWRLGSMGGHLTYEEMVQHLDSMRILYPNLISAKFPIDTTKTTEGRPIWGVRISDNPNTSEADEPQAMFSAVHHAREPVGMHQLIYFMWYLLENYNQPGEIQTLVNRSELYFVPCLNPDGYLFNQNNFPNGGGMWRKNRRDNLDGTRGVDLNRNYGHEWGHDDFGSSPDPESDTYRGTSGFSEPETRAMKAFCEANDFKMALNYHTYSNLVIHPWGYEDLQCPDSTLYRNLTREMVRENNYRIGTGMQVLNYNSNGSSDDYMYSTTPAKPKIFAMTPEVGDWFWPTQDEILPLCKENLHQNLTVVRALHPLLRFQDSTGLFHYPGLVGNPGAPRIRFKVQQVGTVTGPGSFTISFTPFGSNTAGLSTIGKTYSNQLLTQTRTDSLLLPAGAGALSSPNPIFWRVAISNGLYTQYDTIVHYGGKAFSGPAYRDNCEILSNWSGSWVVSNAGSQSGNGHLKTTSGSYFPGMRASMIRKRPFDLRPAGIKAAEMSFWTRFETEKNYDFASVALSIDSGANWENVCTDKTGFSSPFSSQAGIDTILPIWDGKQATWRKEFINLQDFLGQKVWLKFFFRSDDFLELNGFEVDNIEVRFNDLVTGNQKSENSTTSIQLFPNPGSGKMEVLWTGPLEAKFRFRDMFGRVVFSDVIQAGSHSIDLSHLPSGTYWAEAEDAQGLIKRLPYIRLK